MSRTSACPIKAAVMRIQQKVRIPVTGIVDELTISAATSFGYSIHGTSPPRCSVDGCDGPISGPFWLAVFGSGRMGLFVACCEEHSAHVRDQDQDDDSVLLFRFQQQDFSRAAVVMDGVRIVRDVMAS